MAIQRTKVDRKRLKFSEIDDFLRFSTYDFWKKSENQNPEKNILTQNQNFRIRDLFYNIYESVWNTETIDIINFRHSDFLD